MTIQELQAMTYDVLQAELKLASIRYRQAGLALAKIPKGQPKAKAEKCHHNAKRWFLRVVDEVIRRANGGDRIPLPIEIIPARTEPDPTPTGIPTAFGYTSRSGGSTFLDSCPTDDQVRYAKSLCKAFPWASNRVIDTILAHIEVDGRRLTESHQNSYAAFNFVIEFLSHKGDHHAPIYTLLMGQDQPDHAVTPDNL